jgi:shikimate kinase
VRVNLVGVSCVRTTTIGRLLADRRGWPFFDLDEEIERHEHIADPPRFDDVVRVIRRHLRSAALLGK